MTLPKELKQGLLRWFNSLEAIAIEEERWHTAFLHDVPGEDTELPDADDIIEAIFHQCREDPLEQALVEAQHTGATKN